MYVIKRCSDGAALSCLQGERGGTFHVEFVTKEDTANPDENMSILVVDYQGAIECQAILINKLDIETIIVPI